ncbi:hypothetical protein [Ensifer canadensis]
MKRGANFTAIAVGVWYSPACPVGRCRTFARRLEQNCGNGQKMANIRALPNPFGLDIAVFWGFGALFLCFAWLLISPPRSIDRIFGP